MESRTREKFPLTTKWTGLIRRISYQNKIPLNECIQEALVLEWEIAKKDLEEVHRSFYFKKSLKRRLYGLANNSWAKRKIVSCKKDFDSDVFIDNIICCRPFDVIYFEELITHIVYILHELDVDACSIFAERVKTNERWKEIKTRVYSGYPHNKFYNKVKIIKRVVVKEVSNKAHSKGSMALQTVHNNATGCASLFGGNE